MFSYLITFTSFITILYVRDFAYKNAPASIEEKNAAFRGGDNPIIDGYDDFHDRNVLLNEEEYYHDTSIF